MVFYGQELEMRVNEIEIWQFFKNPNKECGRIILISGLQYAFPLYILTYNLLRNIILSSL